MGRWPISISPRKAEPLLILVTWVRRRCYFLDGHCSYATLQRLGYKVENNGVISFDGVNRMFTIDKSDTAWVQTP